mgnify:CR=1 FL=1
MSEGTEQFKDLIERGHSIVRIENDIQQQIAVLKPRDEAKVLTRVLDELHMVPEYAKKVYYSIPHKDRSDDDEKTVWVEGVSINGSMAIQRRWGNSATGQRVIDETNERIICEGVFMDYELNNRVQRQVGVLRMYKPKGKNVMVPLREDRLAIAVQSSMSKAVRNAVLHGIPESIKMEYLRQAKAIAGSTKGAGGKPVKESLEKRLESLWIDYEGQGISKPEIVKYLGKQSVNEQDYERLVGLLNAITEGYVKKDSIFVPDEPKQTTKQAVNIDDII